MITKYLFEQFIKAYSKKYNIISIDTLDKFINEYNFGEEFHNANFNKIKGDIFEYISKYYYMQKNLEVYLFNEIPISIKEQLNLGDTDKGIDLIYKFQGKWIGVQCKWRSNTNECINKDLIAGFIIELERTNLDYGYVFTNVSKITAYHANNSCKWIARTILNKVINKQFIDFILQKAVYEKTIVHHNRIKLRKYQIEALNEIRKSNDKNMKATMACGTGKSIIMYQLIKDYSAKKVLCLMPSLQLVSQFYKLLTSQLKSANILCICSQMDKESLTCGEETDNVKKNNILNEFLAFDDVLYTTELEIIKKRLEGNNIIVLCTYQSSQLLKGCDFNFGIFDEAHKTVNSDSFGFVLKDENCKIDKRIYFTATPRYYKGTSEKCISMDNKEIYGNDVFTYSFKKAIDEKHILDFQIVTYVVPKEMEDIVTEKYIKQDGLKVNSEMIICALQLAQHIKENPKGNKILTYHNSVSNAQDFKKTMCYIFNKVGINANTYVMSGKTSMTNRAKIIDEFEESNVGIICSARVLNEGVDIPCVNTVMFVDSRSSTIDVTQCVGRGMRFYGKHERCNVIIPINYNSIDEKHDYSQIIQILTAMIEIDDKLIEYFVTKNENNKIVVKNMDNKMIVDIIGNSDVKYDLEKVMSELILEVTKSNVLSFQYKLAVLLKYVNEFQKYPPVTTIYENIKLGSWFQDCKSKIKDTNSLIYIKLSKNEIIKNEFDRYLDREVKDKIYTFDESLYVLFEYVKEYGKIPTNKTKYNDVNIGLWYQNQKPKITDINSDIYIKMSQNDTVKENLDQYINREVKRITFTFDEVFIIFMEYVNLNGKVPTKGTSYKNINISEWLQVQKKKINDTSSPVYIKLSTNSLVKQNLDLYLSKEKKEKIYTFDEMFEILLDYIKIHNSIPKRGTKHKDVFIAEWYQCQKCKMIDIKSASYIKLSKNPIVKKNLDQYLSREKTEIIHTFNESLEIFMEYVKNTSTIPTISTMYKNIHVGKWLQSQKRYIKDTSSPTYIKLSINELVKNDLDQYLNREKKERKHTFEESKQILFNYVDKYGIVPTGKTRYENIGVGNWFQDQKKKIKDNKSEIYIILAKNTILKENLDQYLSRKNQ